MVITTDNLVKIYNTRHVVDGVSISVEQGSVVGLLGPNGAGKTTTFYMIVGIEKPDAGTVMLDGKDISSMPMYERACRYRLSAAGGFYFQQNDGRRQYHGDSGNN